MQIYIYSIFKATKKKKNPTNLLLIPVLEFCKNIKHRQKKKNPVLEKEHENASSEIYFTLVRSQMM